ncbi:MAG: hypothetical protein ACOX6V_03475 [Patescibacteria group bacterium]|jgi:peptidoglycan hydrolase CwlO-like protein
MSKLAQLTFGSSLLRNILLAVLLFFLANNFIFTPLNLHAEESDNNQSPQYWLDKIAEYENKIKEAQGQQKTLASTIEVLNNQIYLTGVRISKTKSEIVNLQAQIEDLSTKITQLDKYLDVTSNVLNERIEETYKRSFFPSIQLLFVSHNFSDFFTRVKYLQTAQKHDKELMFSMEEAKQNFDKQKILKEEKQTELEELEAFLESQNAVLAQQKAGKEELLRITKNDEKRFQALLAQAKAEYQAIQSILAGNGDETEIGGVSEGEKIASIISGKSACSTGTHLHFEVVQNGAHTNPASWLLSQDVDWDLCGWYGCDDTFGFTGSWRWPVNGRPRITQGYGSTAYSRSGAYGGGPHTGIDLVADDLSILAVREGILYRGSIPCGGGTLRYVKVEHKDTDIATYYLHVNYIK